MMKRDRGRNVEKRISTNISKALKGKKIPKMDSMYEMHQQANAEETVNNSMEIDGIDVASEGIYLKLSI